MKKETKKSGKDTEKTTGKAAETADTRPWKNTKSNKKKKKGMPVWAKVLLGVLIVVAVIVLAIWLYPKPDQNAGMQDLQKNITPGTDLSTLFHPGAEDGDTPTEVTRKKDFYTFLIIGRDKVALNTDVIIAAAFDIGSGKVATVQIPRDSFVDKNENGKDDEGNGDGRINSVFADGYTAAQRELQRLKREGTGKSDAELKTLCENASIDITPETLKSYLSGKISLDALSQQYGIKKLQNVISRTFGIYFDYYAIISTDAFVKIVDAVGGVDLYVEEDMDYDDPLQDLHIHIKKGQQHLDGKNAEGFVRFRAGYVQADIARLDAQKIFLTALFKKLVSFSSVTRVGEILSAVYDSVDTDLSLENALGFVKPALGVDLSGIRMFNMQGDPYKNGMYFSLNKAENLKIVNEYFNIFSHDLTEAAVTVIEKVTPTGSGDASEGMTMEDISENQPSLGFIRHPAPSAPETPEVPQTPSVPETPAVPQTLAVPETPETPEMPDGQEAGQAGGDGEMVLNPERPEPAGGSEGSGGSAESDGSAEPDGSAVPVSASDSESAEASAAEASKAEASEAEASEAEAA